MFAAGTHGGGKREAGTSNGFHVTLHKCAKELKMSREAGAAPSNCCCLVLAAGCSCLLRAVAVAVASTAAAVVPLACCSTLKCEKCVHYFAPPRTAQLQATRTRDSASASRRNENDFHFALVRSLAQKLNTHRRANSLVARPCAPAHCFSDCLLLALSSLLNLLPRAHSEYFNYLLSHTHAFA